MEAKTWRCGGGAVVRGGVRWCGDGAWCGRVRATGGAVMGAARKSLPGERSHTQSSVNQNTNVPQHTKIVALSISPLSPGVEPPQIHHQPHQHAHPDLQPRHLQPEPAERQATPRRPAPHPLHSLEQHRPRLIRVLPQKRSEIRPASPHHLLLHHSSLACRPLRRDPNIQCSKPSVQTPEPEHLADSLVVRRPQLRAAARL
eukprot:scaffold6162_cov59-Phaeocystis_antarctica.AAC.4